MGSTYQSIIIDLPPARVWESIRNFHDLRWSPNVITSLEKVGELDNGHTFSYSIDDAPSELKSGSRSPGSSPQSLASSRLRRSAARPKGASSRAPPRPIAASPPAANRPRTWDAVDPQIA